MCALTTFFTCSYNLVLVSVSCSRQLSEQTDTGLTFPNKLTGLQVLVLCSSFFSSSELFKNRLIYAFLILCLFFPQESIPNRLTFIVLPVFPSREHSKQIDLHIFYCTFAFPSKEHSKQIYIFLIVCLSFPLENIQHR